MNNKETCKYYNDKIRKTCAYLFCLYDQLDQCSGGVLHCLADEDNIRDSDIIGCFEWIERNENKDRIEKEICELILKHMASMSMEERRLVTLRKLFWDSDFECFFPNERENNCDQCIVKNYKNWQKYVWGEVFDED
jgi:hypothetical protein